MSKDKRELELKRLYKIASKLSGRYKLLFKTSTLKFNISPSTFVIFLEIE